MAQIKWLPEAIADIERIYLFLADKDSLAALRAIKCILEGVSLLELSPRIGRIMDDTGRRELFVTFGAGAYVLRYRLERNDTIVVIRVWHRREHRQQ